MDYRASKDFGAIESDYEFFMASSTESECDLAAFRPQVDAIAARGGPVRMLDLGCGGGGFSEAFLAMVGLPPERLSLSLVEPVESQRREAAKRLAPFSSGPIEDWPLMPADPIGPFDLALANHVLYYVEDLAQTVERVVACLAPEGRWLIAMGGRTNALIVFWEHMSAQTGRAIPYHMSEDLEDVFAERGIVFEREDVTYNMAFPDSTENRMKILRFLLADHLADVAVAPFLDEFDAWSRNGEIVVEIGHQHYLVSGPAA